MLLPIRHENMSARRWPVITLAIIAINTIAFLLTSQSIEEQAPRLGQLKAHILILAAMHPDLNLTPDSKTLVADFRERRPQVWTELQNPNRPTADAWEAKMRLIDDPSALQAEMDSLTSEYSERCSSSISERYSLVPAHPRALAYLTANFLHGGWFHLIG